MGLDAVVCCKCVESGRVRTPPDPAWGVVVEDNGSVECTSEDLEMQMEFDRWRMDEACEHEDCAIVDHYIGNATGVRLLRESLQGFSATLPIILDEVIYNGTHCGDWLDLPTVENLQHELCILADIHCSDKQDETILRNFESQMCELVHAALKEKNPILF
jgi:hypothetical protein